MPVNEWNLDGIDGLWAGFSNKNVHANGKQHDGHVTRRLVIGFSTTHVQIDPKAEIAGKAER